MDLGFLPSLAGAAHGGQVGQQGHAGEVLQHHARDDKRNLVDTLGLGLPARQLRHMLLGDLVAVAVAQHRFEHDTDRDRQALDLRELLGQGRQGIELALLAFGQFKGLQGFGKSMRHRETLHGQNTGKTLLHSIVHTTPGKGWDRAPATQTGSHGRKRKPALGGLEVR
jgi:hypothetical protein